MLTKGRLVDAVLGEIGLPPHVFDVPPESRKQVFDRIERMVGHWETKDVFLSFTFGGDESTLCGLAESKEMAVICNAAMVIAPIFGKSVSAETREIASETWHQLATIAAAPRELQMPAGMPRGAGQRYWRGWSPPFMNTPSDDPLVNAPGATDIEIR